MTLKLKYDIIYADKNIKFGKSKVKVIEISAGNSMEYNLENCIRIGWDYWNDNAGEREDVSEYKLVAIKK